MPSQRVVGAPLSYWAGQSDAQALADAAGLGWLQPAFAIYQPRMVDVEALCSNPPPVAPVFTTLDLAAWYLIGPLKDAAEAKLHQMVDRSLWVQFCEFTDATPPPVIEPQDEPTDLPPNEPHVPSGEIFESIAAYVRWIAEQMVPRSFHPGAWQNISGTGEVDFPEDSTNFWSVSAAGVEMSLTTAPNYQPHTDDDADGIWWDLGWISLMGANRSMPPVRVQRAEWITYGQTMPVKGLKYNLSLDVEYRVRPLYPDTPFMEAG